jgi:hypothetical protein
LKRTAARPRSRWNVPRSSPPLVWRSSRRRRPSVWPR